ncbi:MAG: hypothetical protein ACMXX6_00875 [Candidatus Woesearchaeota archaeon]
MMGSLSTIEDYLNLKKGEIKPKDLANVDVTKFSRTFENYVAFLFSMEHGLNAIREFDFNGKNSYNPDITLIDEETKEPILFVEVKAGRRFSSSDKNKIKMYIEQEVPVCLVGYNIPDIKDNIYSNYFSKNNISCKVKRLNDIPYSFFTSSTLTHELMSDKMFYNRSLKFPQKSFFHDNLNNLYLWSKNRDLVGIKELEKVLNVAPLENPSKFISRLEKL